MAGVATVRQPARLASVPPGEAGRAASSFAAAGTLYEGVCGQA